MASCIVYTEHDYCVIAVNNEWRVQLWLPQARSVFQLHMIVFPKTVHSLRQQQPCHNFQALGIMSSPVYCVCVYHSACVHTHRDRRYIHESITMKPSPSACACTVTTTCPYTHTHTHTHTFQLLWRAIIPVGRNKIRANTASTRKSFGLCTSSSV